MGLQPGHRKAGTGRSARAARLRHDGSRTTQPVFPPSLSRHVGLENRSPLAVPRHPKRLLAGIDPGRWPATGTGEQCWMLLHPLHTDLRCIPAPIPDWWRGIRQIPNLNDSAAAGIKVASCLEARNALRGYQCSAHKMKGISSLYCSHTGSCSANAYPNIGNDYGIQYARYRQNCP